MTLTPSFPAGEGDLTGTTAAALRRIQAGQIARAADGTPRAGVIPAHFDALVTGKASMGYDVGPFVAALMRTPGEVEFVANDASTAVTVTGYAAPGANSRLDVIWVRTERTSAGDAANVRRFGITQGTANVNPSKPAIPPGALELAVAEVKATDTTTQTVVITQTAPYTAMAGGVVVLRNAAEAAAWTPANGAQAYRLDTQDELVRESGAWAGGSVSYTPTWSASGVAPVLGNGSLTGRARLIRRGWISLRNELVFGSSTTGGSGPWSFGLPPGMVAHGSGDQVLTCTAYLAGANWDFDGNARIAAGSSLIMPRLPERVDSSVLKRAQNADGSGNNSTGIPLYPGNYSFLPGAKLIIEGIVELA
ncbi:MAG: hypothetical protein K0S70_3958 [Microbacterium sp.]|jgi:hypothetical protein|nr:hypothetical protein [Microbacterium sp.]